MTDNLPKIVALVPMRHSSERVPGKNYRDLAGKPLYTHIIGALLECPEISQIVVIRQTILILFQLAVVVNQQL